MISIFFQNNLFQFPEVGKKAPRFLLNESDKAPWHGHISLAIRLDECARAKTLYHLIATKHHEAKKDFLPSACSFGVFIASW